MGLFTNGAFGVEVPCVAIPLLGGGGVCRYVNIMKNMQHDVRCVGWDSIMSAIRRMICHDRLSTRLPWEH